MSEAAKEVPAQWWLYIVENRFGQLYTGITTDVARRFAEHQAGGARCARALRGKGPLRLRFQTVIGEHGSALRAERRVKAMGRARRLALIEKGGAGALDAIAGSG
ncbi:GIY-YIG nuclease family protein [Kushneria aurantia]|uniref:GIY-YIG nuclease family protein n=1 Tax=Kushneria aurantia TaxID=504092 RepID=A0ABV6G4N9_9GAMM|nr:GIY-YIG nuclease family protein [Kushneria aurantia]